MKKLLALISTSALLFAACGGDGGPDPSSDPKAALVEGFKKLGESGITATLRLNSTPEDLTAMAAADGDTLTDEQAQMILDSSISVTTNNETDPAKQQMEIAADIAGLDNAVELKVVDETLYARADVRGLAEVFGAPTEELDAAAAQAPPGFEFIGPAIEGQWLSLAGFADLAKQFGGGLGASGAQEEDAQKFADAMAGVLDSSATVTHEGSDDVGDHLVATINIKDFYSKFVEALGSLSGIAAGQLSQLPPESEVPDQDISFDAWVADGRVVQVEFNLVQFREIPEADFPEGVDTLGILLELEEFGGDIEAPSDAVPIDINALMQGFMGGMGGMTGEEPPGTGTELPADFCEQLADAPEEVQSQFSQECPELQG